MVVGVDSLNTLEMVALLSPERGALRGLTLQTGFQITGLLPSSIFTLLWAKYSFVSACIILGS